MPASNLKVLLFSGDYWPDSGGIATHVYYLARALTRKGADVTVIGGHREPITRALQSVASTPLLKEITLLKAGPRGVRGVIFALRALWILFLRRREAWNVVHFHNFLPDALIAGLSGWPKSQARIMTNHSSLMLEMLDQGRSLILLKALVSRVDGIIGPSPELTDKSRFIQTGSQVVRYIPNGVDVELFRPGEPSSRAYRLLKSQPSQKIILAVRRHDPKCGLIYLVRAAEQILRKDNNVLFCLVGHGEQTGLLRRMVDDRGLEAHFRFLGTVRHEVLPSIFRTAYVSVLPSIYEAVSLSGLESMACGVPVIGTRVGGIPEFVHDGITGLLIEPTAPDAIAEAAIELIENPPRRDRMGQAARALVVEEYSWDRVAESTLNFYKSLLGP